MSAVTERVLSYTKTTQEAWAEYLQTIQECAESCYPEIEPHAWVRLQKRLGAKGKDAS